MALSKPSLFLYGLQVTEFNRSVDFKAASGGPEKQATLTIGYYSLSGLATEIKKQMQVADPAHTYTVSIDRTISGGTQNRITISTSGSFLSLLFGTGSRSSSSVAGLIGFNGADYTGLTSYLGSSSAGIAFVTNMAAYNFLPPEYLRKAFGSLNVSASGVKEAVVFATQKFWQAQFKYVPAADADSKWVPFLNWAMLQRELEFTPQITSPTTFYVGTMETTSEDGKALGYRLTEMLPQFPNLYDTGLIKFRVKEG
jgi:hypothetical protein